MNNIEEIDNEIEELKNKRTELLKTQRVHQLAEVKKLIAQYSFTIKELGIKTTRKTKPKPKYKNPQNDKETWSGRGIKPKWVVEYLSTGKTLDEILITKST